MRTLPRSVCVVLAVVLGGVVVPALPAAAAPGVDPSVVELTLAPGDSSTFATTVTTPDVAPAPDIVFLADTTGSMDPALANVRNNIGTIMDTVQASQPNARFGVAEYKEQRDGPRVFTVDTPLTDDEDAVRAGTQQWLYNVGGGGQPWTDFVNALYRIGTDAMAFRPNGTRIVAWFGDARSHDPSLGHTLADTNNALRGNGIHVIAVPLSGTTGGGLDALGQATSITNATDGVLMPETTADQVSSALLAGILALEQTVRPQATCDAALTFSPDPTSRTVRSGTAASFVTTVSVRPDAGGGDHQCTVDYLVNDVSVGLTQTITVHSTGSTLRVDDVTVTEGDSGTANAVFTVALDRPATRAVSFRYATSDGSAVSPEDFAATAGDLIIQAGQATASFGVPIVGDTAVEPDETFTVVLSDPVGAGIADGSGVGTIVNDDEEIPPPVVSIGDATVDEGAGSASFTVALDRASADPATVHFATTGGTATAPADFAATSGDLAFAPGQVSRQVTVPIVGDAVDEPNETFTVTLSGPAGATIGDGSGVGTIVDDDRDGAFTCRASVLSVVANPPNAPCANDTRSAASLDVNLGLLRIQASAPRAATTTAADAAGATAALGTTRISTLGLVVEVGATTATATARCVAAPGGGRAPVYSGSSSIGTLKINGIPVQVGSAPVTIPLVVGSLRLNGTTTTPTGVTQRAIELRSVLGNVVLGEARAGVTGTPAHPAGNPCQGGA